MSYYIDSGVLIADFLRSKVRDSKNRISFESNYSKNLDGSKKVIEVESVGNISYIDNLVLDGTTLVKYKDWVYDYNNCNLVLNETFSGTLTYDVYVGNNWIYHDRPRNDLSINQFPRVSVQLITSPGEVLGNDKAPIVNSLRFQINTYAKKKDFGEVILYDDVTVEMSDQELANKINEEIYQVLKNNRDELYPLFANYSPEVRKVIEPYDTTLQAYSTRQEFIILKLKEVNQ